VVIGHPLGGDEHAGSFEGDEVLRLEHDLELEEFAPECRQGMWIVTIE
jgi:hypothetical protein